MWREEEIIYKPIINSLIYTSSETSSSPWLAPLYKKFVLVYVSSPKLAVSNKRGELCHHCHELKV